MIKTKDGYAKLIGTTYQGSPNHLLLSDGGAWAVHTGKNNEADKIVRTDTNGHLLVGWITTTSGDIGATAINKIYCSNDSYIRYQTPVNFFSLLANSGDLISITVASYNRLLTVEYAVTASLLRSKGTLAPQTGRTQSLGDVYSYHITLAVTGGPTTYAAVIGFGRGTAGTVEIAGEWTAGRGVWVRALRDVSDDWYAWDKVLTLTTYHNITDGRYYTKALSDDRFVNVTGDTMVGKLNISINSTSSLVLSLLNTTAGWTYMTMGNSTSGAGAVHLAWKTTADGAIPANAYHIRPGGSVSIAGFTSGAIYLAQRLVIDSVGRCYPIGTGARRAGMYGTYDSTKIGHIWSMGTGYMIPDDGANFGNLYGLAYKHTNNSTGGTMAGGHLAIWCTNGTPKAALGDNGVWAAGGFYKAGSTATHLLRGDGGQAAFNWSGLGGQPTWLWGGNAQHTYYVYNPSNFNVAKANKADQLEAYTDSNFTGGDHYLRAIRYDYWHTRLYMGYYRDTTLQNTVHVGYSDNATTASYLTLGFSATYTNNWNCNTPDRVVYSDYGSPGRSISNAPSGWLYGTLLSLGHADFNGLNGNLSILLMWDIAHDTKNGGTLWFRGRDSINGWAKNWCKVLTDLNYTSILDTRYVTSLGTSGDSLTWVKNGTTNKITVPYASRSTYLYTNYIGGVQHNPLTYFSLSVGLKVAMTGNWAIWSDTLWINGYEGGDVLLCVAIHTLRNGQPRMALSALASNATSYGTKYEVWTSYNFDPNNLYWANVKVSTSSSTATIPTFATAYAGSFALGEGNNEINMKSDGDMYFGYRRTTAVHIHTGTTGGVSGSETALFNNDGLYLRKGWLRTHSATGWYNETYGGGIYMTDTSWVRTYNQKGIVAKCFYATDWASPTYLLRSDGGASAFRWSGLGGQPTWLWGGNNQHDYYVYNPSNFSVRYATDSGTAKSLYTGFVSGSTHAAAIKSYFDSNKASIPRDKLISFHSGAHGNGSLYFGLFISGYDSNPYGGFFVAHYNTPIYVGILNGTYDEHVILTNKNYSSYLSYVKGNGGSATRGVYVSNDTVYAMTYSLYATVNSGTTNKLAYYSSNTAISSYTTTVGSSVKPIWINTGVPTASTSTIGSGTKPIYMSSGTLTASSSSVGGSTKHMYLFNGVMTASTSNVGSASIPTYLSGGTLTACGGVVVKHYAYYEIYCNPSSTSYSRRVGNFSPISNVTKLSTGRVKILFASQYSHYNWFKIAIGKMLYDGSSMDDYKPVYVSLHSLYSSYVIASIQDDASRNDGSFHFYILEF